MISPASSSERTLPHCRGHRCRHSGSMDIPRNTNANHDDLPFWARSVTPGCLDRHVLDQSVFWVDGAARAHRLEEMSSAYLFNVLGMLQGDARRLHFEAILDAYLDLLEATLTKTPSGERLTFDLIGRSVGDLEPLEWLETTALVRSIRRLLPTK